MKHPKFDRKATEPPIYLDRLRNKGWWRMHDYLDGHQRYGFYGWCSQAFGEALFRFDIPKNAVFLDAGCGDSPDAVVAVKDRGFSKAYKVDLFPPSTPTNSNSLKLKEHEDKLGIKFIQSDICEKLPLKANSIDLVSCNAMIDLIPEDDRILFYKEAYRLLKPAGVLSVSIIQLANGYGTDDLREHSVCVMPGWGVGFKLIKATQSWFVVQKPKEEE